MKLTYTSRSLAQPICHVSRRTLGNNTARLGLVLVTPALLSLLLLVGWPMAHSALASLSKVTLTGGMSFEWAGLSNYAKLVNDPILHQTLLQSSLFTLTSVSLVILIGLVFALLLNRKQKLTTLKTFFLLPWALSPIVNAVIWSWIFHGVYGVFNYVMLRLHLIDTYRVWLADPTWALPALTFATIWKGVPFAALMLLAALQNIPESLLDAAKVDGANSWESLLHIRLPLIKPTLLVLLIIETMWSLKSFDLVWVLTQGGPINRTMLLSVYAYQQSFQFFNFGYGAALSYTITALVLLLTILYLRLLQGFED